jgi:hypothetical protein
MSDSVVFAAGLRAFDVDHIATPAAHLADIPVLLERGRTRAASLCGL